MEASARGGGPRKIEVDQSDNESRDVPNFDTDTGQPSVSYVSLKSFARIADSLAPHVCQHPSLVLLDRCRPGLYVYWDDAGHCRLQDHKDEGTYHEEAAACKQID